MISLLSCYKTARKSSVAAGLFAGTLLIANVAHAQTTLFSDLSSSTAYPGFYGVTGPTSMFGNYTEACSFVDTTSGIVTSMSLALFSQAMMANATTFMVSIMSDSGTGVPGPTTLFTATNTVNNSGSPGTYTFSSASGSALTAGTTYWAVLSAANNGQGFWVQNTIGAQSAQAQSNNGGTTYTANGQKLTGAFSVSGSSGASAPEPGTLLLLSAALPVIGRIRHRPRGRLRA